MNWLLFIIGIMAGVLAELIGRWLGKTLSQRNPVRGPELFIVGNFLPISIFVIVVMVLAVSGII